MKGRNLLLAMAVLALLCATAQVQGQVPQLINYQGQLTDASGNPSNGTFTMVFAIYDVATGGTALWTETQSVTVTDGVFNVLIGSVTPIPLNLFDSGTERYLQITVGGTVLTPRRRFGSVPYAFVSRATGGTGVQQIAGGTGITVTSPTGPIATVSITANSINDALVQDNSLTDNSLAANSVGNLELQGNAVHEQNILPDIVSSIDGVRNDAGNIDLIAGANVTITPNDAANTITIAASGGTITSVDSLQGGTIHSRVVVEGDIETGPSLPTVTSPGEDDVESTSDVTADENMTAGGNITSNGGYIVTGSPTAPGGLSSGDIAATDDVLADDIVRAGGFVASGLPSSAHGVGDVAADADLVADDQVLAGGNINSSGGAITTGSPTAPGGLSSGDIAATDDVLADDIVRAGAFIASGLPSRSHGVGDVAADNNLVADVNLSIGGDAFTDDVVATNLTSSQVWGRFAVQGGSQGGISIPEGTTTGDVVCEDDLLAHDDVLALGTKSAVAQTASYGIRRTYADESTEVMFFDRGRAQLSNGQVKVELDPIFAQLVTITPNSPMLIQITLTADCNGVYVADQTSTSFTVKELRGGTSNATFNWEVAARRKGYESTRLEQIQAFGLTQAPQPVAAEAVPYSPAEPNGPVQVDAPRADTKIRKYPPSEPNGPAQVDTVPKQVETPNQRQNQ